MTQQSSSFALTDAIVFTGSTFVEKQAVLIENGLIVDFAPNEKVATTFVPISCANQILAPGFIDCQVNGGGNVLLNDTPTIDGVLAIAAAHRKTGTTRLIPTCISDKPETMRAALQAVRDARKIDPSILGTHFEGPHLSPSLSGAHDMNLIRPMNADDVALYQTQDDEVFILTLSPEMTSPDQIRRLVKQGVIVAIGHSDASLEQVQGALDAGARGFTHIMNRMPPIMTREPGVAVLALNDRNSYAGLIADGRHIHPELVRLVVRAKADNRLYMVSDAAPPAGADEPLPYTMGGVNVTPKNGLCVNDNGVICGAHDTLGQCVSTAIKTIRLDPDRVLRMASTIPAEFLGLGGTLGKILPGYKADIVALNHSFQAQSVWRDGIKVA